MSEMATNRPDLDTESAVSDKTDRSAGAHPSVGDVGDVDGGPRAVLVEAEQFDDLGGWVVDSQFAHEMGSPYLLAHGNGVPVADASTTVTLGQPGSYSVWVRAKDWVPGHHPGRFTLSIGGMELQKVFGADDADWSWEDAGSVDLAAGPVAMVLHDLTGFGSRCDAVYLDLDGVSPPAEVDDVARSWRRRLLGLPEDPVDAGDFDVVVIGGGVPGATAALMSARLGDRVALVHDRPVLGGNASVEVGLSPRGITGPLVDELSHRSSSGDLVAADLLEAEPRATVFLDHSVYDATTTRTTEGTTLTAVRARDNRSGREIELRGRLFIDCTGTALLGRLTGASTMFGQESRDEHGESLAPERADDMHHGDTVFFRTSMAAAPRGFPDVPWATEVAGDFADLRGQLERPGVENGPGPLIEGHGPDAAVRRRMKGPLTHFWEYGQWLDPDTSGEHIRDHLLRAVYGTFSNVKRLGGDTYTDLELDWVAHVAARGEHRRYLGDHVLTETDIRTHRTFPDAVVRGDGAFCLHYPGDTGHDFRLGWWEWDVRDGQPYDVPLGSLYSRDVNNLLVAGKHISATHVAGSNAKFMGNGGQHAIAAAAAAHLCVQHKITPRQVRNHHVAELRELVDGIAG